MIKNLSFELKTGILLAIVFIVIVIVLSMWAEFRREERELARTEAFCQWHQETQIRESWEYHTKCRHGHWDSEKGTLTMWNFNVEVDDEIQFLNVQRGVKTDREPSKVPE